MPAIAKQKPLPPVPILYPSYPISVAQYLRMVETNILGKYDKVELLEGYIVPKMPRNPPHDSCISKLTRLFYRSLSDDFMIRCQMALVLDDSVPEPDIAIVRDGDYSEQHPAAHDALLVVEVAYSSIVRDRTDKARVYARNKIPQYWVIDLIEGVVIVCKSPKAGRYPRYENETVIGPEGEVSLVFGKQTMLTVPAHKLLPG